MHCHISEQGKWANCQCMHMAVIAHTASIFLARDGGGGALLWRCKADEITVLPFSQVYPDAGVAAMLSYQWQDRSANFAIASLNDRRPVAAEDEMVVFACPDPQGADDLRKVVGQVADMDEAAGQPGRPIVLFNQRLSR